MIASFLSAITQFVFGLIEILIVLRIVLKMLGASVSAPFIAWLYETTEPLLSPFIGVFPTPRVSGGFVLEISALVALVVYGLAGFLIKTLIEGASGFGGSHHDHHDDRSRSRDRYRD